MGRGARSRARSLGRMGVVALTAGVATLLPVRGASAHEVREVGDLTFVVGWSNEPAYAGFGNEVQVIVTRGERPVEGGDLEAEVVFGDPDANARTDPIPLEPAFDAPNEYLGYIIPTRPGTYSFQVTGSVAGEQIDETFTSGEDTFDDVQNPTDAEFPVQDPTRGELSEKLDRITARLDEVRSEASSGDPTALWIAIGSGLIALVALTLPLRRRPG
jgi:hypothetical protein